MPWCSDGVHRRRLRWIESAPNDRYQKSTNEYMWSPNDQSQDKLLSSQCQSTPRREVLKQETKANHLQIPTL